VVTLQTGLFLTDPCDPKGVLRGGYTTWGID